MADDKILNEIEAGLIALHRSFFQHKGWEQLKRESGIKLDRSGAAVLKVLAMSKTQICPMSRIASNLGIEAPSVTRAAQQLEYSGYITKKPDATDGRVNNLQLTDKGRKQIEKLQKVRRDHIRKLVAGWNQQDKSKLAELLSKLSDNQIR